MPPKSTAEKLAKENNVSHQTVKNYGKKAEEFESLKDEKPDLYTSIYSGEKKKERGGGYRGNQHVGGKSANFAHMPTAEKLAEENKIAPATRRRPRHGDNALKCCLH